MSLQEAILKAREKGLWFRRATWPIDQVAWINHGVGEHIVRLTLGKDGNPIQGGVVPLMSPNVDDLVAIDWEVQVQG